MATNSPTTDVSYLQVYKSCLNADQRRNRDLTLPVNVVLLKLICRDVLTKPEYQMADREKTDEGKIVKLFLEIMPSKGEHGFKELVDVLLENKFDELAKELMQEKDKYFASDKGSAQRFELLEAQTHLRRLIKENVDFMANYWSDVIRVAQTQDAFVDVQILENFKAENGTQVHSFREMFHKHENTIHKRILIKADPGCGKTTYVNKLALDWANEDEYLSKKFDFVFLIALQTLTLNIEDAVKCFLPKQFLPFFQLYADSSASKILLVLDGFDEMNENSVWYLSVMDILTGQSLQFQFYHIIVTTRRSHIDKIPQRFRERSLLIKGFDPHSMIMFLNKQHVPLPSFVAFPSFGSESNLFHLLQTPLFCAIYCSLHSCGGEQTEFEDSYDLIRAMVENCVANTTRMKTVLDEEKQLEEIGKFAFGMLDSKTLEFLKAFCKTEADIAIPSFDLSTINLDLLIKRRIPTAGINRFKEEISFPHQLIAEFLAARYFARSLTDDRLKQVEPNKFFTFWMPGHPLQYPFIRFLFFELYFVFLEKNHEVTAFENFLNVPEVRFFWQFKSTKSVPNFTDIQKLWFSDSSDMLIRHSRRFFSSLAKCHSLSSLSLSLHFCSGIILEEFGKLINGKHFQNVIELDFNFTSNIGSTPSIFTALHNCQRLETLKLASCNLTVESIKELAKCISQNGLDSLKELSLLSNENVGPNSILFAALRKCVHLQRLDVRYCKLSVASIGELANSITDNGIHDLKTLELSGNENIGSSTALFNALQATCKHFECISLSDCQMCNETIEIFAKWIENNGLDSLIALVFDGDKNVGSTVKLLNVLHKCPNLRILGLRNCSTALINLFSTFSSNTFQNLTDISFLGNDKIEIDDNFYISLQNCPKITNVLVDHGCEHELGEAGQQAKVALLERGCPMYCNKRSNKFC